MTMEEKTKQKRGGSGVGDMSNKNDIEREKSTQKSNTDVRPSRVGYYTTRGLRGSNPLSVVAIQTIDIFIRVCYLQCPDFLSQEICF